MTISTMNIFCGAIDPATGVPWIDILGSGLIANEKLKLKKQNGTYVSFLFAWISPYWLRISNFDPVFAEDIYTVEYDGRDMFTGALSCPILELTGIYYIDSTPGSVRDTYNQAIKKIPDPTIRTALIGE